MGTPVKFTVNGQIAEVVLEAPPSNALKLPVRQALSQAVGLVENDPSIRGLIIRAEGKMFSAGAEIREAENEAQPTLRSLCSRIEALPVPVIAGLQGTALGGGAELALSAHFRLFSEAAHIGFPEVTLGLIPNAGATQRLPRIVGAKAALDLLIEGRAITSEQARQLKLANGVVKGAMGQACLHLMKMLIEKDVTAIPAKDRREALTDGTGFISAIAARRAQHSKGTSEAAMRIIDCVEAALIMTFDVACDFEQARYNEAAQSPQSRALRHVFVAERRIDTSLLARAEGGKRKPSVESGAEVVDRLRHVLRASINHVAAKGTAYAKIDGAFLELGFAKGPFEVEKPVRGGAEVEEIKRRCIAALMAEGARMVEAGLVTRSSDIDALAVHGMGFPRLCGGPMKAAHLMGLLGLRRDMQVWANESRLWTVPRMMDEAVKYSAGFDALVKVKA